MSSGAEVAQIAGYVLDFADAVVMRMDIHWDWSACVETLDLTDRAVSRGSLTYIAV